MKKLLLTQILIFASVLTFAQKTATSVTCPFTGVIAAGATSGTYDDGTGFGWYTDNSTAVVVSQNNEQIITLTAASQYNGWGAYTYDAGDGSNVNKINISANPYLEFKIKSDVTINFQVALQTGTGSSTDYSTVNVIGGAGYVTIQIDYTALASTVDFTQVQGPRFQLTDVGPHTADVRIDDLKMGSTVVLAGTKSSSSLITESKLFPNPSQSTTSIEFNLLESSDVKVILTDAVGKQLDVVVDETMSAGLTSKSFDVSDYGQGIYYVNYYVNNNPSGMKMLMVK